MLNCLGIDKESKTSREIDNSIKKTQLKIEPDYRLLSEDLLVLVFSFPFVPFIYNIVASLNHFHLVLKKKG